MRLSELDVLAVDCQATTSGASGHLLELSWARASVGAPTSRLIKLPSGVRVPPAVARLTGITQHLSESGVEPSEAFRALCEAVAAFPQRPAPAVAHYARFERPWLERLSNGALPLELVCTHEMALRLFPELPRRGLRALAGYFGHSVGSLRRGAEHVEATLFVWRRVIDVLGERGIDDWAALTRWLENPVEKRRRTRRVWPMPRETRLALPHRPGLYRMLRTNGDVLYVGKAASLHHRVNSYFRKQRGIHERTLEMLSQARGLSFEITGSPLEAALLEPDEIKRHRPPYNVALMERERGVWFCSDDLRLSSPSATETCSVGPFSSLELIDQLLALARGSPDALGRGRWAPPHEVFAAGLALFRQRHLLDALTVPSLLRLGTRLWAAGRRARDDEEEDTPDREWTQELVARGLEWLAIRGALARRRARWLTRLTEAAVVFTDEGVDGARLLLVDDGAFTVHDTFDASAPVPVHHERSQAHRQRGFTVARLDRLRVLTTELKRLISTGRPVSLCLGPGARFSDARLGRILEWL